MNKGCITTISCIATVIGTICGIYFGLKDKSNDDENEGEFMRLLLILLI